MAAAFHFDLVDMIGQALKNLTMIGRWKDTNYTVCFPLTPPDAAALQQAVRFKEQLKRVSRAWDCK